MEYLNAKRYELHYEKHKNVELVMWFIFQENIYIHTYIYMYTHNIYKIPGSIWFSNTYTHILLNQIEPGSSWKWEDVGS